MGCVTNARVVQCSNGVTWARFRAWACLREKSSSRREPGAAAAAVAAAQVGPQAGQAGQAGPGAERGKRENMRLGDRPDASKESIRSAIGSSPFAVSGEVSPSCDGAGSGRAVDWLRGILIVVVPVLVPVPAVKLPLPSRQRIGADWIASASVDAQLVLYVGSRIAVQWAFISAWEREKERDER